MCFKNLNRGFTLAEVLITLGIIGVVAGLTIPNLLNNTKEAELKISFKKAYSEISQMANFLRSENGGTLNGLFTDGDEESAIQTIAAYFSSAQICDQTSLNCFPQSTYNYTGTSKLSSGYNYAIVLKSGTLLRSAGSASIKSSCNNTYDSCMSIGVDVNGTKGPNRYGKDNFFIRLQATKTVPYGISGDSYYSNCGTTASGTYSGIGCAGWIIEGKDY